MNPLKLKPILLFILLQFLLVSTGISQYKTFKLNSKGDTINAVTNAGLKHGKWVVRFDEIRGEPGFEEEGEYKKGEKDGYWRRYNLEGDLIGVEHFILGGKDGVQQYFNYLGELLREESWKGYNPDAPFDTIAVYGTGSGEIIDYKIVKAEPYSVKNGDWKYYEPGTGRLIKSEKWDRNNLVVPEEPKTVVNTKPKKVEKTPEMIEWELKNKGKKGVVRDGRTGL